MNPASQIASDAPGEHRWHHRPGECEAPPAIRNSPRFRGKPTVTIFDCRPPWHPNLTDWSRVPVAQLRYNPDNRAWTLYWADRNSRWHRYDDIDPGPIDQLLNEINDDPTSIFWG